MGGAACRYWYWITCLGIVALSRAENLNENKVRSTIFNYEKIVVRSIYNKKNVQLSFIKFCALELNGIA